MTTDIFSLEPIVVKKVGLEEILKLLRNRTNKNYMPTATRGDKYNSKPDYTDVPNPHFPDFPKVYSHERSGYYCLLKPEYQGGREPVFFNLRIDQFQIVISLQTEQAIIRTSDPEDTENNDFVIWHNDPSQTIPLMRDELAEAIDTFG